jgi:hypothetical protein
MRQSYRTVLSEASLIIVAAVILSFVFTGTTGREFLRSSSAAKVTDATDHSESTFLS